MYRMIVNNRQKEVVGFFVGRLIFHAELYMSFVFNPAIISIP